jgi:hypothetical protein
VLSIWTYREGLYNYSSWIRTRDPSATSKKAKKQR